MNYITVLIFFTSFFLEIFNTHAVLIECYVNDISNFDKTNNYVETKQFCNLDIPIDNINDDKINLDNLKKIIKNQKNLVDDPNNDKNIINNIENYIITEAYYYKYDQTILNFEKGNIIIPKNILNNLKNSPQGHNNCIVIEFISEESFEKLKSATFSNINIKVEDETKNYLVGITIKLGNLQEGCYKKDWDYTILQCVIQNISGNIEEWEGELKMKFLNDGSDFKILQDGKPVNILQCLKNNNLNNLTLELQFAYQFMFNVEYKPKNKDYKIRDDFDEEDFKNENGNEYKTLKDSKEIGEKCKYYKNLVIIIKKKEDFKKTIKEKFKSEDRYRDLDFKINDNFDIDYKNLENLLGKKNKLTVICSEFSEYVKSYVVDINFAVDNKHAGVWVSEYSICKELDNMKSKKLAFTKKEDITAENIKKKLKIVDKNLIEDKILMYSGVRDDENKIEFDQNKFFDSMQIYLNINKEYALNNNIIIEKKTNTVSSNNYNAKVQIFNDDKLPNSPENNKNDSDKTITNLNSNNGISNLNGGPNCCCVNCCANCCK